jgi:hypothetical protein
MIEHLPNYNPAEHSVRLDDLFMSRRQFLRRTGMGIGGLGLATLLSDLVGATAQAATLNPLAPKTPPLPARAKSIIHIFAEGGPSHIDTWDPKPALEKFAGKALPGLDGMAYPSPFKFEAKGKSGIPVSEVFPRLGEHVDDMCVIRSMFTDVPAHEVAQRFMNTGSLQLPKPSVGSWVLYGLGTVNQNMPGFITIGGKPEWRQASFLPGVCQGVNVNYQRGMPLDRILLNIRSQFTGPKQQRAQLDLAQKLNQLHAEKLQRDDQLEARIESFEMAFKMQTEATDAFDITKEPESVRSLYGPGELGAKLLVARRLVERGVRFVQVSAGGWDHHQRIEDNLPARAADIDQPAAALLTDLKKRGLLGSTLVIWGGEFGRTVTRDRNGNEDAGRDHNARGFSMWLAGGGVRGGHIHGATDEFGARAVHDKVHVHDLHATLLSLLGFDHTRLIFRYNGRDFRLTDNYGKAVRSVIA